MRVYYHLLFFITLCSFSCKSENSDKSGHITIDGSSTVYPISNSIVKQYQDRNPNVKFDIKVSGTGGGFRKLISNEVDIVDASRKINDAEQLEMLQNNISYFELKIGIDEIVLATSKTNKWLKELSQQNLIRIWKGEVIYWNQINDKWPHDKIVIYSPGNFSGTRDCFNELILNGQDFLPKNSWQSENDNNLVKGIAQTSGSIGYFGKSYFVANKDQLNIVKVVKDTNTDFKISRPLYIYLNCSKLRDEVLLDFMDFYIDQALDHVAVWGGSALSKEYYLSKKKLLHDSACK